MQTSTSSLPKVIRLAAGKEEFGVESKYRLLMADPDYIVVFEQVEAIDGASFPFIIRFSKGEVHVLETIH